MPATFYLILHKDLRLWQRFALMCIVVSGIGLVILVVGQNAMDLVRAGRASRHSQKALTGDAPCACSPCGMLDMRLNACLITVQDSLQF